MDQPGMMTNPARGQLNMEKCIISPRLIIWSRGIGSAVPSRASLLSFSKLRQSRVLTHGISPVLHGGRVHIYCQSPSGQSRDYRATQMRANGVHCRESIGTGPGPPVALKAVLVTDAAFSGFPTDHFCMRFIFSHTHYGYVVDMCNTESIRYLVCIKREGDTTRELHRTSRAI